jgi:hypothetical protein
VTLPSPLLRLLLPAATVFTILSHPLTARGDDVIDLPASSAEITAATDTQRASAAGTALRPKVNAWGKRAAKYQIESRSDAVRFRLVDRGDGDAHLVYPHAFKAGTSYRATLRIRSDDKARVEVILRRDQPPWDTFGARTVQTTSAWQTVEVEGTVVTAGPASLRLASQTPGADIHVDRVSITEVGGNPLAPVLDEPIPDRFFGMHLNRLGAHRSWPSFQPGVIRLWDTGTSWKDLQPEPAQWDFSGTGWKRLEMHVEHVRRHSPSTELIYTMGQSPRWASSQPDWRNGYGYGHGAPPANLEDWREYVRTVARRYAGRIRYWELWNEADYAAFYKGSVETMVAMARIAHEELRAADPQARILSPGLTVGQGVQWLDRFLALGGGRYVDIIAFHWYYDASPEGLAGSIDNVRRVMRKHGVGDKPLWNTEGGLICNPKKQDCKPTMTLTDAQRRSANLRAMLTMWTRGVSNFDYYFWEGRSPHEALVERDFRTPTLTGEAYARAVSWLRGARVLDAYRLPAGVFVFRLERGGTPAYIAWSTERDTPVRLPKAWNVMRVAHMDGEVVPLPPSRELRLGGEPVMLQ